MKIVVQKNHVVCSKKYTYITDDYLCALWESDLQRRCNVLLNSAANQPSLYRRLTKITYEKLDGLLDLI